jgi:ubiquinone biosynthesis protein COQ9
MWWLSFFGGVVVIMEASSIAHARLLATMNDLGHPSHFVEGYSISPELAALVPDNCIGRMLSPEELRELLEVVRHGTRKYALNPGQQPEAAKSRRRA